MEAKFSGAAKEIIAFSRQEAIRLKCDFIGVGHVFLGIIRSCYLDELFNKLMNSEINIHEIKTVIEKLVSYENLGFHGDKIDKENSLPLTKDAERAIRISTLEAKLYSSTIIEPIHLLLSLARKPHGNLFEIETKGIITYDNVQKAGIDLQLIKKLKKHTTVQGVNKPTTGWHKSIFIHEKIIIERIEFETNCRLLKEDQLTINSDGYVISLRLNDIICNGESIVSLLKKLKFLKSLEINNCKITKIEALSGLFNIKKLKLTNLGLTSISFLYNFNNLTHLNLSGNLISNCDELEHILKSNKLNYFNIFNNKIEVISEFIYLKLSNSIFSIELIKDLKNIVVKKQQFEDAADLRDLGILIEEGKKFGLTERKLFFRLFFTYFCDSNPLNSPTIETFKLGHSAVLRYYENIKSQGLDFIYEAKLTLVGDGGTGKTSLQLRLNNDKSDLPIASIRTRGIEVTDWVFKRERDIEYIAHIWDFGGQDMYYPVHRFFITENSVFVLLSSTRFHNHNFEYWIPTIFQFGNQSPIIIGQTCHEGTKKTWNDLGSFVSSANFNIIKTSNLPYIELNLPNNNEGLNEIKNVIINQLTNLGRFGKAVPKSYSLIRKELFDLKMKSTCITLDRFSEICKKINSQHFVKYSDITDCCSFFHDIGVLLWYSDNVYLRSWVILQPDWAMNAVYLMIDDYEIQNRKGRIIISDFERLWQDYVDDGKSDVLKKMLESFNIAFQKKHLKGEYILPARLESIPSQLIWNNNKQSLIMEYKFEFMPKGLVNQLSAELSRYLKSDDEVWNNAVNFSYSSSQTIGQVQEDLSKNKIKIITKGEEARELITLIKNGLQDIIGGYKGVTPEILVPCACSKCNESISPHMFLFNKLLEWRFTRENGTVVCNESSETLYIETLIYNVGLNTPEKSDILIDLNIKAKTKYFISYSGSDELYLEEFLAHFKDEKRLEIFYDRNMKLGSASEERLLNEIEKCDYFICLVSKDFFQTQFIMDKEIPEATKHKKTIIPIILKPCDWESSTISDCQVILKGKVITVEESNSLDPMCKLHKPEERDFYWKKAVKEIKEKTKLFL